MTATTLSSFVTRVAPVLLIVLPVAKGHACVLLQSGKTLCWDGSDHVQLGVGAAVVKPLPTEVVGLPPS
jgi:hypothetical protein